MFARKQEKARWPRHFETYRAFLSGAQGPRDKQGRSLREMDLKQKLFRYPCSYLIYSEAFDALPPLALEEVYGQLWQALNGQSQNKALAALPMADRQAVLGSRARQSGVRGKRDRGDAGVRALSGADHPPTA